MKHLAILFAICISAAAHAQWGKAQLKVHKLPYSVDSFTFRDETVPVQRFKEQDLNSVLGDDAHENRVALAITKLQEQLGYMREGMMRHQKIGIIGEGQKLLDEIKSEGTKFDPSLLEREYRLYYKHKEPSFDAKYDGSSYGTSDNRSMAQKEKEYAAIRERIAREDAQRLKDSTDESLAAIAKHIADSTRDKQERDATAASEREEARQLAMLKKKYGEATFKKAADGKIWIGMTEELCAFAVGPQAHIKRTTTQNGTTEEWLDYAVSTNSFWARKIVLRNHVVIAIVEKE